MGLLMGLLMVVPLFSLILLGRVTESLVPDSLQGILGIVAAIMVLYTTVTGSIGAAIGGALASKRESDKG